jgi:hypothetical protein
VAKEATQERPSPLNYLEEYVLRKIDFVGRLPMQSRSRHTTGKCWNGHSGRWLLRGNEVGFVLNQLLIA